MLMSWPYQGLAQALSERPEDVLAKWLHFYRSSRLRLPGPMADDELSRWFAPLMESLTDALAPTPRADGRTGVPAPGLIPGADDLRELEKSAAFLGARLAAEQVSGFDVAAVFTALRETVVPLCDPEARPEVDSFLEWLTVLAVNSMSTAREQALRERQREELEAGTPIVLVSPDVIAVFLIGSPDKLALETILGKTMLRVARVGARAVILDLAGLANKGERPLVEAVAKFLEHRKIAGHIPVILAGIDAEDRPRWSDACARGGDTVSIVPTFERAFDVAGEHSEYRLVRRG